VAEGFDADAPVGDETPLDSVVANDVELAGASDVCSVVGDVVTADRSGGGEHPARSAANTAAVIDHRAPGPVDQVGGCQQAKSEGRIERHLLVHGLYGRGFASCVMSKMGE
jgi:hypothetical protein